MTSVAYHGNSAPTGNAAQTAFCVAFFFLPISKALLFVALAAAFALFFASGTGLDALRRWRTLGWVPPALVLAALPLLSLVVHDDRAAAMSHLGLSYYWLLAYGTVLASSTYPVLPWLRAFVAGMFVAFCYSTATTLGWIAPSWTPSALGNYILYSQLLAMAIVLLSVLYRHEQDRRVRWFTLLLMAGFYAGLLTGDGRSGMLAVLVLMPFVFFNIFPRASMWRVVLVSVIAVAVLLMSPRVQTRIEAAVNDLTLLQSEVTETSLGYRYEMWRTAAAIIHDHLWLGAGPEGFNKVWHSTPKTGQGVEFVEPHNAFLYFASSYGLPGLAALVWLYVALLLSGWRQRATLEGGVLFAFAVVCIVGSFTNTMFRGTVSHVWLMLFIGLAGGLLRSAFSFAPGLRGVGR
ncbi:MAG TPA: O-antigen ligase family protein [Noviherbaspirillum sp.]|nr:O-antigen ligase family protein [Noviherbaspirillum sp.]